MLELGHSVTAPDELVRRLTQLHLCHPADFRRARAWVRRLSHDLPAFDSVWIDALLQLRRLTPFQARMIERGSDDQLLIGNHVVLSELGQGPHGTTFLAQEIGSQDDVVLKRLNVPASTIPECRTRLTQLVERSREWSHPHLELPRSLLSDSGPLVTVSRWIPGLTLSELLVRRGRLPADVVLEIARQLASGLASLHRLGLVHSDIRLSNVRLTANGSAVLVDGGIRPAVCPELTIHDTLALEAYDGVAPELIGTGQSPDAASEMYALGCLLWQLLTGRPPHWMADPLMKLAAHQTQRIADVRTLAPDTPVALAGMVNAMTSPDVNERPRSFDDLLNRWGRPGLSSRRRVKRYRTRFDGAVPHFALNGEGSSSNRWPWVAVMLFVAVGMALTLSDQGLRSQVLAIPHYLAEAVQPRDGSARAGISTSNRSESVSEPAAGTQTNGKLLTLPSPSADGVIILAEPGPYDVARVAAAGDLTIRGASGINPVIQIGSEALWLSGDTIKFENVAVVVDPSEGKLPAAMVKIQSRRLQIHDCIFQRPPSAEDQSLTAVAWRPVESDHAGSKWQMEIRNTVFEGSGAAIWSAEMPDDLVMSNCLKWGDGACIAISPRAAVHAGTFELSNVTIRETGPLLRLAGAFAEQTGAPTVEMTATDCVFALANGTGLIELEAATTRSDANRAIHMGGQGSVLTPRTDLAAIIDPSLKHGRTVLDADEQFEGIVVSDLQFAGPVAGSTENSRLQNLTAPRSSAAAQPGIDVRHLRSFRWNADRAEIRAAARPAVHRD